jgi:hypothetical protein
VSTLALSVQSAKAARATSLTAVERRTAPFREAAAVDYAFVPMSQGYLADMDTWAYGRFLP